MKIIDIKGLTQPDPYILKSKENYYIYCTGADGIHCYKSFDLFEGWQHIGIVFSQQGQKEYWAPSVIERNNRFFMYYSSMPDNEENVHTENIKLAVCDTPDGKFEFVKDILTPFSIDAHVVENSAGLWMFYSLNRYVGDKVGTYIVVDRMKDEYSVEGNPRLVVSPTIEEEIFQKNRFQDGQDWYTIEGAFYFKKDGWHYCIYSANCYFKSTYHLGYASCRSDSDELDKLIFVKHSANKYSPLLSADKTEMSTGHNSLIEVGDRLYLVYHGRDITSDLTNDDRTARVCRLFADNGILSVEKM